jgi:hypothetical protein
MALLHNDYAATPLILIRTDEEICEDFRTYEMRHPLILAIAVLQSFD